MLRLRYGVQLGGGAEQAPTVAMGGGASKAGSADSNAAIKKMKEGHEKQNAEIQRLEKEKEALQKKVSGEATNLEALGQQVIDLEREKKALAEAKEKARLDQRSAEKAMEAMRKDYEELKAQNAKFDAELRDIKGDLIEEKEQRNAAEEEKEKASSVVAEKEMEKAALEAKLEEMEEEKKEMENMLRLSAENAEMYKDLSSKMMTKKQKPVEAAPAGPAATAVRAAASVPKQDAHAEASQNGLDDGNLLKALDPKQQGRYKVLVISTFEDFFEERKALKSKCIRPLNEWCDKNNCVLEVVDMWEGMLRDQYAAVTHNFYIPALYLKEIEDSDIVLLLMGEKYGPDMPEEVCSNEASVRTWLNAHKAKAMKNVGYGSILELAATYAAFVVGKDAQLPANVKAPRVMAYMRNPAYVQGLPDSQTKNFSAEGAKQTSKLNNLKDRIRKEKLVMDEEYPDPHALAKAVLDHLQTIFEKTQAKLYKTNPADGLPKKPSEVQLELITHEMFMDAHAWIGQGEKGVQLPDAVSAIMERIRKYAVNDAPQPLVLVGELGSGKTSMCHANVRSLTKRFPPPNKGGDTLIISHFTGVCNAARDPICWMHRVCKILKNELGLQLKIPGKPSEMISEFPLWLAAAASTALKLILIVDGIDQMAQKRASDDPIGFLPKTLPSGVRCIVSTGPGPTLTSLAQRGCGAITLWPMDEQQKEMLVNTYVARNNKEFDKKGVQKLVKSKLCSTPQFLTKTLAEIHAIGVLDGSATMEPMLYYLEADNMNILTEKAVYRWESKYDGKILGGSLVRDTLTCLWAARRGLRRSEITGLMRVSPSQLSPLLLSVQAFLTSHTGYFNFQSQSLADTVCRRYLPTTDAQQEAHRHLAGFFGDRDNATLGRRVHELPWQIAQANDPEALCKCITNVGIFQSLCEEHNRPDMWAYVNYLEQKDCHLNLPVHCKASKDVFQQQDPKPEFEESAELDHKYGSWLAEIGFFDLALQFLMNAMEEWSKLDEDDARVARTCEVTAKVLANMHSPDALTYFKRAEGTRMRLGSNKTMGMTSEDREINSKEFAMLNNEFGLYLKRQNEAKEAEKQFSSAIDRWSKLPDIGPDHLLVANAKLNLCTVCYATNQMQKAQHFAEEALDIRRDKVGPNHPLYAEALVNWAAVELARDRGGRLRKDAIKMLREGIDIFERTRGGMHPDTLWARSFIGEEEDDFSDEDDEDNDEAPLTGNVLDS